MCACGLISFQRGLAHSTGGVTNRVARGIYGYVGGGLLLIWESGSGTWILYGNKIGVAGTMPVDIEVGLGCLEYPTCVW